MGGRHLAAGEQMACHIFDIHDVARFEASTAAMLTGRRELPLSMSAVFAPASTIPARRARNRRAQSRASLGVISCGFSPPRISSPTDSPPTMRGSARAPPVADDHLDTRNHEHARRFDLGYHPAGPDGGSRLAGNAHDRLVDLLDALDELRIAVEMRIRIVESNPDIGERITMRSASTRQATSAASVSLSPKRICSTDTVSFSFTIGTTSSSSRRDSVS